MDPKLAARQLIVACRLGDKAAVQRQLHACPSAAGAVTSDGLTALQVTCSLGNADIVSELLKHVGKAAVNTTSKGTAMSPLSLAACGGHSAVITALAEAGADVNLTDTNGWTALHHAAFKGRAAAAATLLRHGADINAKSTRDETPLALACVMEQEDTCHVLLANGADVRLLAAESDRAYAEALAQNGTVRRVKGTGASSKAHSRAASIVGEYSQESFASEAGSRGGRSATTRSMRIDVTGGSPGATRRPEPASPGSPMAARRATRPMSAAPGVAASSAQQQMSMADLRGPQYAITLPATSRRASPMYTPLTDSTTITTNSTVQAALKLRERTDAEWVLQAFPYKGASEGFVLDKDTGLVYWAEPRGQAETTGGPHVSSTPVLVGKLLPGFGGLAHPSQGQIAPLTAADAATVELSAPAVRCLRRHNPVVKQLAAAARDGVQCVADLTPELGGLAYCRRVLLTVPLCTILGVHTASELSQLTAKDLTQADIDPSFLPSLLSLSETATDTALTATEEATVATLPGSLKQLPVLPNLSQLLVRHGLAKLLPVAAEKKLLSVSEIHRWDSVATAAAHVALSVAEQARLRTLLKAITQAQEQALSLQASRLDLLTRLTVGCLVIYETDPLRAVTRGERLAGIVVEDLGAEAGASVTGKQYKVRDLLDDTIIWQSPGQVRRIQASDATSLLRADLLPPATAGAPVTSHSASAGLRVQLAPWASPNALLREYEAAGIPQEPTSPTAGAGGSNDTSNGRSPSKGGAASEDPVHRSAHEVIGVLLEPVTDDRLNWAVLWPDGIVRSHCVGSEGRFDLVHIHVHRAAGAPLTRAHFKLMLGTKDMMAIPVVRSPLWSKPHTDDQVPGTPGLGFLDAAQADVSVVWSRARDQPPSVYCPDAQGLYPLCHGVLGGTALTLFMAKPAIQVEASPNAPPAVVAAAAAGPGTLVQPVGFNPGSGKVTWRVRWASGSVTTHDLGTDMDECELQVSAAFMANSSDRVVLLNEVSKRANKSASAAAALASVQKAGASACGCGCGGSGSTCRRVAGLGRPLFAKDPARAHTFGMLGSLVKLNLAALGLQPGCDQGPLASYEPRLLSESLAAKKEGIDLGPIPRDDVGIVVKDAGPGTWRSLLVRKLGSTRSFWYDESVLLPANPEDVKRQVARNGPNYPLPRHYQGVPVTNANAAPGMLVQRAYAAGAAREGSDKALAIGELIGPAGDHEWDVLWPDGSVGTYKTGARNRFQLCFVNLHERAGAPLMAATVAALAAAGAGAMAVVEGPHSCSPLKPGTVRYVNDAETNQGLLLQEVAQLHATGMVATSAGERCVAGGALRLYELSHAVRPGDAVTVFTAKRGLAVTLAAPADNEADMTQTTASAPNTAPEAREGILLHPTRLAVRAVIDPGSGTGSGMPGGPTASREPTLLQDPACVYWEVQWSNGRVEEVLVGTTPSETPLRIAGESSATGENTTEGTGEEDDNTEEVSSSYDWLAKKQSFVRMLDPVILLPARDAYMTQALQSMAEPLQRAVGWTNQMMRELCAVWWAAACLEAACADDGSRLLWRPQIKRVAVQPDLLLFTLRKRQGGEMRWETLLTDANNEVSDRVPESLDERLALAADTLTENLLTESTLTQTESETDAETDRHAAAVRARHALLDAAGRLLDASTCLDEAGKPQGTSESLESVIQAANSVIEEFRLALANGQESVDFESDQYDLAISLEPSISSSPSSHGGASNCIVVHLAKEQPTTFLSETDDSNGETDNSAPWAVGPLALLGTGYLPMLQSSVLSAHRAMGAMHAVTDALVAGGGATGRGTEGEHVTIIGAAQHAMWLDISERLFPSDLGQARCLASVNAQLFTLRRVCASLNACPAGGSANVSAMLLAVLRAIREKVAAAIAYATSNNLMEKAKVATEDAEQQVKEQLEVSTEISPFDHARQDELLRVVNAALQRLNLSEALAVKACHYAQHAMPPASVPGIEQRERDNALEAQQASKRCLEETVQQYNYLYLDVIDSVKKGVNALTKKMRDRLIEADVLAQEVKQGQTGLLEARKAQDVSEKGQRSAEDDLAAAQAQLERKEEDVQRALRGKSDAENNLQTAHSELQMARAELNTCGPDEAERKAAEDKVSAAEATVTERQTLLDKAIQHRAKEEGEVDKCKAAIIDAQAIVDTRRATAADAKQAVYALQAKLQETSQKLRTLDPGSLTTDKERGLPEAERMARQVKIAQQTTATSVRSLEALQRMASTLPSCMYSPDAVARLLNRTISAVTLATAAAAAETARAGTLSLESLLMSMEEWDAIAGTVAALGGSAMGGASVSLSATGAGARSVTGNSTAGSGGAGAAVTAPFALPAIDEVYALMGIIRNDVMTHVRQFSELAPHVPDETTIEDEPGLGKLSRAVLSAVVDRTMTVVCTVLERLGQAAANNVAAAVAEAAAAAEASKQPGAAPANPTDALTRALHAARVATLVAETARSLPATSADMPVSDQKLAMSLVSQLKAAQNANNTALKESTKLANEQVARLSKQGLGAAATLHSVLCVLYSDLACKAKSTSESRYWCSEAASLFPKARTAADTAITALMPPPPPPPGSAEEAEAGEKEGDDSAPEKKREDPAEYAAKLAAAREQERVINRYMSEVALKLAQAAVDWAGKLMSPLSDSSSIDDISEPLAEAILAWERAQEQLAVATQQAEAGAVGAEGAVQVAGLGPTTSQTGAAEQGSPLSPPHPHPDNAVQTIQALVEPLTIADLAFRQAGNHTGLDEIDEGLRDVLTTASQGARTRATVNYQTLRDIDNRLEDLRSGDRKLMTGSKIEAMQVHVDSLYTTVSRAIDGARRLVAAVPLVIPPEKVPRDLSDASRELEAIETRASELRQRLADTLESLTGDVSTAMASTEALMHALEPSFIPLQVTLKSAPSPSSMSVSRPASPSRRTTRRTVPSPPTLSLELSIEPPSDRYEEVCNKVTEEVLHGPTVRALLAPYHALLQAANEAACAVHAAAHAEPTDSDIERLLNPGSVTATTALGGRNGNGSTFMSSTNELQLKRWAPTCAVMSQSTSLVIRGFIEATDQCGEQLSPLELLWMV